MTDPVATQQAEFDAAFAQAQKPAPVIDPAAPLPHYPAQRYVDKNLAAEKTLTYGDVSALARAQKLAESKGVLTPDVAAHMLPMAMVEGRTDFGVNGGSNAFSAKPATISRMKSLGMTVTDMTDPAEIAKRTPVPVPQPGGGIVYMHPPGYIPPVDHAFIYADKTTGAKMVKHTGGAGAPIDYAKAMASVMAEKYAVDKSKTAAGTIKLFNGSGPETEQYWKKVQDAKTMINHPKNKALLDYYTAEYNKP